MTDASQEQKPVSLSKDEQTVLSEKMDNDVLLALRDSNHAEIQMKLQQASAEAAAITKQHLAGVPPPASVVNGHPLTVSIPTSQGTIQGISNQGLTPQQQQMLQQRMAEQAQQAGSEVKNEGEGRKENQQLLTLACQNGFLELAQVLLAPFITSPPKIQDQGKKEAPPSYFAQSTGCLL